MSRFDGRNWTTYTAEDGLAYNWVNAKIVITEHGVSPTLLLGSLPVTMSGEQEPK